MWRVNLASKGENVSAAKAKPRPKVYTPDGCANIAKLIQEGLHREKLSYSQVQLWIERRVDVPEHLSVPQGASLGMLITGKTRTIKVETLRILHCAGLFGDRPLEVIEAIACGMSVEEAELLPGKSISEDLWDQLPAKIKSAPRDVQVATAIAIIESLGSEGDRASSAEPHQPQPSTAAMFFKSPQEAQQRLGSLFRMWHPSGNAVAIAQYYAKTLGVDLISVARIEKLLKGETLLSDIEYGCFCTSKLNLQKEDGDRLTSQELRWFCQTAWGDRGTASEPESPPPSADHQDTLDS
ncbi:MAG: hypothetical protein AAGF75_07055 [Cyanobacteria bacterium P01_H01_bin.130]